MPKQVYFRNLAVFAIILTTSLSAQERMSLRFLAFPKSANMLPVELLVGEGETIKVDTPGNQLSAAYEVPSLSSLVVGATIQSADDGNVFKEYGRAKSLAVPKQIVLLLRKGKEHSDGFVIIPIDGSLANFSGASFLFINASNLGISG